MLLIIGVEWRFLVRRFVRSQNKVYEVFIASRPGWCSSHLRGDINYTSTSRSHPLTPISSDPNDLIPLAPSDYLIRDSLTTIPKLTRYLCVRLFIHPHSRHYYILTDQFFNILVIVGLTAAQLFGILLSKLGISIILYYAFNIFINFSTLVLV